MATVKVKFIEMIWDNYQGASGKPIKRNILVNLPNDTTVFDIECFIIDILTEQGIKGTYNSTEKRFPYTGIISIEILPII